MKFAVQRSPPFADLSHKPNKEFEPILLEFHNT
jgi:hypothetical protein